MNPVLKSMPISEFSLLHSLSLSLSLWQQESEKWKKNKYIRYHVIFCSRIMGDAFEEEF